MGLQTAGLPRSAAPSAARGCRPPSAMARRPSRGSSHRAGGAPVRRQHSARRSRPATATLPGGRGLSRNSLPSPRSTNRLPAPDRRAPGHASLPGDRPTAVPGAAQEDDPGPPYVLLRAARRRDDRFEASTIPSADFGLDIRSHPPILARIAAKGILSLVTNH